MPYEMRQQVIRNPDGKIKYWVAPDGGREHYHVGIWIEGNAEELDKVEKVEYTLHPSFRQPMRRSTDRSNKFGVTIWTWGMFLITANVYLRNGESASIQHYLTYDLPADEGSNYVRVDDAG